MPASVGAFERRGAIGEIFIHPGTNVHEGICTSIWGAPTAGVDRPQAARPRGVHQPSGRRGADRGRAARRRCARRSRRGCAKAGCAACCRWRRSAGSRTRTSSCWCTGTTTPGTRGIGDNATGDAALLELARVLWGIRDRLKRIGAHRVVARPFHRPLRGIDLVCRHLRRRDRRALHRPARHRLAGLRRRDRLRGGDVDGGGGRALPRVHPGRARPALGARPAARAPATTRSTRSARPGSTCCCRTSRPRSAQRRGYYAVGGCGGNIAWHTRGRSDAGAPISRSCGATSWCT